ncbi:MAG: serine/threonine-protein kinase [Verrucomicrobiales bacterium]|nr:serine/threonine-protein kinase [Verrucomicrobiales bacterium]
MADKDVESDAPGCQDEDSDRTLPIDADVPSIPPPSPEDVFRDMLENPEPTPPGSWEPVSPEKLNQLLPGFQVIKLLGRGGMGAVYEAVQENLDRHVAIKVLPPELGRDIEFEARFRREAKAMARLNHPNIIQIHDFGQTSEGHFYFVMEFVDGSDLHFLIKKGLIKPDTALKLAIQICEALQFAHDEGFVHRDIKPANILLTSTGVIKIGDFGLAKLIDPNVGSETDKMGLTMTGYSMGTPNYMAPEQMNGENQIDHRADIYSLGVMLYEMLTGEIPRGSFDPPSNKTPVDARIDDVVLKAMHEKPDFRYQAAKDIESDVTTIRTSPRGYTIAAKERKERTKAVSKSNIWLRVIAVLLLSAAVIAGAVIWQPSEQSVGNTTLPTTENEKSQLEIPATLSEMKKRGGRLRAWSHPDSPRPIKPVDRVDTITDFVTVDLAEGGLWIGLRADKTVRLSNPTNEQKFERLTNVVQAKAESNFFCLLEDGTLVEQVSGPDGIQNFAGESFPSGIVDFDVCFGAGAFVLNTGEAAFRSWGRAKPELDETFAKWAGIVNREKNNVSVALHDSGMGIILREDGTTLRFSKGDLKEQESEYDSFGALTSVARAGHWLGLTEKGEVVAGYWDKSAAEINPGQIPKAYAIKANLGISAAQLEDGSWFAWGDNSLGVVDKINSIGPAIDIDFYAQNGTVIWIEPATAAKSEISISKSTGITLPSALAEMKKRGGRLRGWVKNGQEDLLQLSKADGIDDVIELDGTLSSYDSRESARWVAKRRGGSTATSLENFPRANEIFHLTPT